jgi:hypothetical protein
MVKAAVTSVDSSGAPVAAELITALMTGCGMLTSLSLAVNPSPDAAPLAKADEIISLPVRVAAVAPCAAPLAMEAISGSLIAPATPLPTALLTPPTASEVAIRSTSIVPVVANCMAALIAARSTSPGMALTIVLASL